MMSVLVNTDGQICIASDSDFKGMPVSVTFNPARRQLTLQMENGQEERLGTSGLSEINRLLHSTHSVRFMRIRKPGAPFSVQLPLYLRTEDVLDQAVAI